MAARGGSIIRLQQSFGVHAGRLMEFDQDKIRLGRMPDNDVVFDPHADLDASGQHAEIVRDGHIFLLVDLGSRNGTYVDGVKIDRVMLRGGEEIEFGAGGPRLRAEIPKDGGSTQPDAPPGQRGAAVDPALIPLPTRVPPAPDGRVGGGAQRPGAVVMRWAIGAIIVGVVLSMMAAAVLLGSRG